MNKFSKISYAVTGFFLVCIVAAFKQSDGLFEISKNIEIYSAVYKEINTHYVDELKPGDLMKDGIAAMLLSLDPYTNFYTEAQAEDAMMERGGEYGGIGCRSVVRNKMHLVTDVFEGGPSEKAGMRVGDYIVEVNGKSYFGRTNDELAESLKGSTKGTIIMKIKRGNGFETLTINRAEIQLKNISFTGMINSNTGMVKLDQFMENCSQELKTAILELKAKPGFKNLILDLRDNPGGLLHESVNIVNLFIDKDQLVVSTKGRDGTMNRDFKTLENPLFKDMPLIVLVNNHSASASEIVSGTLQDLDRAVVIGRNSYGKGLVQNTYPLPYRHGIKITTAKYYTPSGRCIQLLDYSKRNEDGSAGKVADSMRKSFKTRNGRMVLDGGGIRPDIETGATGKSSYTEKLENRYVVFDFATEFRNKHTNISSAREFKIDENLYSEFIAFALANSSQFKTETESYFDLISKSAKDENYSEALSVELNAIEIKLKEEKKKDLLKFRKEIEHLLVKEIVRRYYNQSATIEATFNSDPDILNSLKLFENISEINRILGKTK